MNGPAEKSKVDGRSMADHVAHIPGMDTIEAVEYLKSRFLVLATEVLEQARTQSGLTQEQLARVLKTTQSVVSRTENDLTGSISMRRYVDWMVACGTILLPLEYATLDQALDLGLRRSYAAGSTIVGGSKSEQPVQNVDLKQDSPGGASRFTREGDLVGRDSILERVRQISQRVLGDSGYRLYLFGSFARREERTSSDIDIAVESTEPLPLGTLAELREHLEESNIPYHVDVLDLRMADPHFQARVREEGIRWND